MVFTNSTEKTLSPVCVVKDTEGEVQGQQTGQGELQLVVKQWTVGEDSFLDTGLHRTLHETGQLSKYG